MAYVISEKRIAANQRNAQKSTGPTTEAGKTRSRGNALKHGLSAIVVSAEDPATVRERSIGVMETIRPQTKFQAWACTEIAIRTIRLDRLRALEQQVRTGAAWRADNVWDDDQRLEAERIAARLPRDPARTVALLRRFVHGTDWLIDRWAILADVADRQVWSDEQKSLANDLLGTPRELRDDAPGHTVTTDGQAVAPMLTEAQLARMMLGELNIHRDRVAEADAMARSLAIADLDDFNNRDLIRLRRYERSLINDLNRFYAMSQHEFPHTLSESQLTRFVPPQLLDPPILAGDEPTAAATATQNEPIAEVSPSVQNEPIAAETSPAADEVVPKAIASVQNELIAAMTPALQNEPMIHSTGRPMPPAPSGLSPALIALLEDDLSDPATLDPSCCRDYLRAMVGSDRFAGLGDLKSLLDLDANGRKD